MEASHLKSVMVISILLLVPVFTSYTGQVTAVETKTEKTAQAQTNVYKGKVLTVKRTDRNHSVRVAFVTYRWDLLRLVDVDTAKIQLLTENNFLMAEKEVERLTKGIYYTTFPSINSFGRYKVKGIAEKGSFTINDTAQFRVDYFFNIQDKMQDWSSQLWSFLNASTKTDNVFGNISDKLSGFTEKISGLADTISNYFRYSMKPAAEPWTYYIVNLLETTETNATEQAARNTIGQIGATTNIAEINSYSNYFDKINSSNLNASCFVIYTANVTTGDNYTQWFEDEFVRSMIGRGAKFFLSGAPLKYIRFSNGTTVDVGYELWHDFQKKTFISPVVSYNYTKVTDTSLRQTNTLQWVLDYLGLDLVFPKLSQTYTLPEALVSKNVMVTTNTRKPAVCEINTPGGGQFIHFADGSDATLNASLGVPQSLWNSFTTNLLNGIQGMIGNFFSNSTFNNALEGFYDTLSSSIQNLNWSTVRNTLTNNFVGIFKKIKDVFSQAFSFGATSSAGNIGFQMNSTFIENVDISTDIDITGQLSTIWESLKQSVLGDGVVAIKDKLSDFTIDLSNVVNNAESGDWSGAEDVAGDLNNTFDNVERMFGSMGSFVGNNTLWSTIEEETPDVENITEIARDVANTVYETYETIDDGTGGYTEPHISPSTSSASTSSNGDFKAMGWDWITDKLDNLRGKLQSLRDDLEGQLSDLSDSLRSYINTVKDNLVSTISMVNNTLHNIKEGIKKNLNYLKTKLTNVTNWANNTVYGIANKFWQGVTKMTEWVNSTFQKMKGWVKDGLNGMWDKLGDLAGYINNKVLGPLRSIAANITDNVKDIASNFFQGIKDTFTWFYENTVKPVGDYIFSWLKRAGTYIKNGLNWVVQQMVGFFRGMVMQSVRRYTQPLTSLIKRSIDTVRALASRVTDIVGVIKNYIKKFVNRVSQIPDFLKGLSKGIAKFLTDKFDTFYSYIKSFQGDFSDLENSLSKASTFVSDKVNSFVSTVKNGLKKVSDLVYALDERGRIPETFKRIGKTLGAVSQIKLSQDQYGLFHFKTKDNIYLLSVLENQRHNPEDISLTLKTYNNKSYSLTPQKIVRGLYRAEIPSQVDVGTDAVVQVEVSGSPEVTTGFSFTVEKIKPIKADFSGRMTVETTNLLFSGVNNPVTVSLTNLINSRGTVDLEITVKGANMPIAWKTTSIRINPLSKTSSRVDVPLSPFYVSSSTMIVKLTDGFGETLVIRKTLTVVPSWVSILIYGLISVLLGLLAYYLIKTRKSLGKLR